MNVLKGDHEPSASVEDIHSPASADLCFSTSVSAEMISKSLIHPFLTHNYIQIHLCSLFIWKRLLSEEEERNKYTISIGHQYIFWLLVFSIA